MSQHLARPAPQNDGKIRVNYPEVVIEVGGHIVRALPTRVGDDMYIASKVQTKYGVVENVTRMPMAAYERGLQLAYERLGPKLYQHYLHALPAPPARGG
jgi:hypothetical protein